MYTQTSIIATTRSHINCSNFSGCCKFLRLLFNVGSHRSVAKIKVVAFFCCNHQGQSVLFILKNNDIFTPYYRVGNVFGILFLLGVVAAILYLTTMSYMKQRPNFFITPNLTNVTSESLRSIFTIRYEILLHILFSLQKVYFTNQKWCLKPNM